MPRIIDGRIITDHITAKAITQPKVANSAIGTAQIIDGNIADGDLDSLFQKGINVSIDSVLAWVSFPTAYGDTPVVITAEGPGVTYARVQTVTPGSFQWVADAAGSASWYAWGHR